MMIHSGPRYGYRMMVHQHIYRLADAVAGAGEPSLGSGAAADAGEPLARPMPLAPAALLPQGDARLLRRLRHVVRRRLRVDLDGLVSASAGDGELVVRIETVSPREPRLIAWSADRLVALVVLHDGCGARVVGGGGLMGRVELPSVTCDGAFLSFCYDADAASRLS